METLCYPANDPVALLMGDLTDALEILYSCRTLDVPVTRQFLDYIDILLDQIEAGQTSNCASA